MCQHSHIIMTREARSALYYSGCIRAAKLITQVHYTSSKIIPQASLSGSNGKQCNDTRKVNDQYPSESQEDSLASIISEIVEVKRVQNSQETEGAQRLDTLLSNNSKDHFLIPLGGVEEIGMNCNLYIHQNKFLMIDLGVNLTNIGSGSTAVLPDLDFVMRNKEKLTALVITHAHEDHIGAVASLWPDLGCPLYCTKFTAEMIRARLPAGKRIPTMHIIEGKSIISPKPFKFHLQHMTHSIPESYAVVLHTSEGYIFHTGDWKYDSDPVIGPAFDYTSLSKLGEEGVLAVVGDSTNATVEGDSIPETEVQRGLSERLQGIDRSHLCVMTCFSSSISRIKIAVDSATRIRRRPALMGHAMLTTAGIAHDCGYLPNLHPTHALHDVVAKHAPNNCLMIATGCQGEPTAALARMASGDHPIVHLSKGDAVIFSSRTIPGNEFDVQNVTNQLKRRGVNVIMDGDNGIPTHASGHAYRGDIRMLLSRLKPRMVIPVHGQHTHLDNHGQLAQEQGIQHTIIPRNGDVICFDIKQGPVVVGKVSTGRLVLDGRLLRRIDSKIIQERRTQHAEGSCFVTVVLDSDNQLFLAPMVTSHGLLDPSEINLQQEFMSLADFIATEVIDLQNPTDEAIQGVACAAILAFCQRRLGKRPSCQVHVVRQIS